MELVGARPGKFAPKCQGCGQKFALVISEDPNVPPVARPRPKSEPVPDAVAMGLGIDPPRPQPTAPPVRASSPSVAGMTVAPASSASSSSASASSGATSAMPSVSANPAPLADRTPRPMPFVSEYARHLAEAEATIPPEPDPEASFSTRATLAPPREPEPVRLNHRVSLDSPMAFATAPPREAEPPPQPQPEAAEAAVAMSPANRDLPTKLPNFDPNDLSDTLGGYQLLRKLGQGGMGSVYLAKQLSLDRDVAVKVLAPALAQDASFVARFTREAYAAAQLTHHNVVQIYDIGEEAPENLPRTHFFSMEFVHGRTLADVVEKDGLLDPEVAVGHVLQAARGLKFAHDHGMIHRDIKPENLLVNDQGIVKVADLGLVKRAGLSDLTTPGAAQPQGDGSKLGQAQKAAETGVHWSMGTPAYMAPEQAKDAAHVDVRADVYSLGCTMYDLLTGRPPFTGRTAVEVMTKHAREPITPPDVVVKRVPKALSAILMKMVAKKPEERYQTMDEVIRVLEDYLGIGSSGPFSPKEEHALALESAVRQFNDDPLARLRSKVIPAYFLLCGVLAVVAGKMADTVDGKVRWAGGFLGLGALTFFAYLALTGILRRTILFRRVRQYVFGSRLTDWLRVAAVAVVGLGLLVLFDLHWVWLGFAVAAVAAAAAFYFGIDLPLAVRRKQPITQTEAMLKTMRLRGLEEESLRQFVCKYAGARWEEFYETLFGYEAKLLARKRWGLGERGRGRRTWGAWRDPIISAIDERLQQRKEERERRLLAKVEQRKLQAEGVDMVSARAKAKKQAARMVERAAVLKESVLTDAAVSMRHAATAGPTAAYPAPNATLKASAIFADVDQPHAASDAGPRERESYFTRKYGGIFGFLLNGKVRFAAGAFLIAGCVWWMHQNGKLPGQQTAEWAKSVVERPIVEVSEPTKANQPTMPEAPKVDLRGKMQPLHAPGVPSAWAELWGSYNAGLAGLLLILSSLFRGGGVGVVMLLSTFITLLGSRWLPGIGPFSDRTVAMVLGGGIGFMGLMLGRK